MKRAALGTPSCGRDPGRCTTDIIVATDAKLVQQRQGLLALAGKSECSTGRGQRQNLGPFHARIGFGRTRKFA
jgi:hypothetical protein